MASSTAASRRVRLAQYCRLQDGRRAEVDPSPNLLLHDHHRGGALANGRHDRVLLADSVDERVAGGDTTANDPGSALATRNAETTHGRAEWTAGVRVTPKRAPLWMH